METNKLSLKLRSEADSLGLCKEWHNAWKDNSTEQELINKCLRGIDFCLQHKWPDTNFIRSHFDTATLRQNMILADDKYSLNLNKEWHDRCIRPYAVLLGKSESNIRISCPSPVIIYLNDESQVKIFVHTHEMVRIEVRGNTNVEVLSDDFYRPDIQVVDYSTDSVVIAPKYVTYKQERDYLSGGKE